MSGSKGPDWYNETDIDKMHMLAACSEGNIELVREFIEGGVHVEEFDDDGITALQIAAARGYTKLAEYLLSLDPDLECCNVVGYTALLHACREGHIEVLKLLIQRGAKLDVSTFTGASPLTLACAGGHFELVKYLLTFKDVVEINPKSHITSPSPLMAAAFKNQPVIASCLVSRGARTDYVMPQYSLDIISSVIMCSTATMFSTLLDLGAKIEGIRNYKNSNIDDLVNLCQKHDMWRVLVDHKRQHKRLTHKSVDIRQIILEGHTVELIDVLKHSEKCTKLENGETPLMYAVIFGQIESVRAIIDSKADLNAQEIHLGLTALMIAAILGDNELIMVLMHAGAKTSIKCNLGWSATEFAYSANGINPKVIALMHRRQADLPFTTRKNVQLTALAPALNRSGRIGGSTLARLLQRVGLTETEILPDSTPREEFLSGYNVANINFAAFPERFIMANDILNGDNRRKKFKDLSNDDYMRMIRNIAASWKRNGSLLKPFALGIPFNGDYGKIFLTEWESDENSDFDGNYSKAQRNCAIMIGQAPSTKASSNSLSSVYSDSSYLRKSGASSHLHNKHLRRPPALSASASGAVIGSRLQPPASPSAHSLGEIGAEKLQLRPSNLPSHLRSMSSSSQSNRYQYLHESSPRISPKRIQKLSNSDDFIQQKLKQIGLQRYSQAFRDQEVDITTFLKCDILDVRQIVSTVSSSNEQDIAAIVDLIAELRQLYASKYNLEHNK